MMSRGFGGGVDFLKLINKYIVSDQSADLISEQVFKTPVCLNSGHPQTRQRILYKHKLQN
jgi:hypothetical protein